ncbi:hypothetical protein [Spiribacter pallidus]|jgi:hypothetical protein|uniref:DUF2232 domain-containing protein n=1 Tax=Spiribacter pallidus TaxID=1987936 RepID=A0ABV3TBE4_9GAMM
MSGFLAFLMRSRPAAVGIVALGALMPLLFWLSGAVIALVTLRRGVIEGALIAAGAALVLWPLYGLLLGMPAAVLQPIALIWLPVMLLAEVLRRSVSLSFALQTGAVVAAVGVAAFYGLHGDPTAFWQQTLNTLAQALAGGEPGPEWQRAASQLAPRLTGLWVVNMLAVAVICLLLGRWWQAVLYNPGGFRAEFHELRFARWFAVAGLAGLFAGGFAPPGLMADAGTVIGGLFVLQALAVAHAVVARRGWHVGWLIGFYLILPLMLRPITLLGLADAFVDFRTRLSRPA